jgi:hypothetical protein
VTEGPFPESLAFKTITVNMFVPPATVAGLEFVQVFLVFSGEANGWYQNYLSPKTGWNALKYKVDPAQLAGGMGRVYIVFNTGGALRGPVYVDNISGTP